jgi:hypothetical protein
MRSGIWLLIGATLFVIGGFFLMRGEQRDEVQDARSAAMSDTTEKLAKGTERVAESTAKVAEATEKLGGAVRDLSENARRDEKRLDKLEGDTADLKERVEAVEDYIPKRESAIAYNFIASDLNVASMAKVAVAEALMSNGAAPSSNAEAGLPAPGDMRGQSLRETHVRSGGTIELIYDTQHGVAGGSIKFIPDVALAMRSGIINWRCETADFPEIAKFAPACDYVGNY